MDGHHRTRAGGVIEPRSGRLADAAPSDHGAGRILRDDEAVRGMLSVGAPMEGAFRTPWSASICVLFACCCCRVV